jgi:cytochrome bd-type quinol oxidase subunit 1
MNKRTQAAIKVFAAILMVAGVLYFLRPVLIVVTGSLMFLVSVLLLPAIAIVIGWFIYSVWGRVYLRAWRIQRLRNARDLKEAVERGRSGV